MAQCELNSREDTRLVKSNCTVDGWPIIDTIGVQLNMRKSRKPFDTTTTGLPATYLFTNGRSNR